MLVHAEAWFAEFKQKFDAILNQRARELQALGLPVPRLSGELAYEARVKFHSLSLVLPALNHMPPTFRVHSRSDALLEEGWTYSPAVYVVTGTTEEVHAAVLTYEQRGIIALVREHTGKWLNRDPYNMYESLHQASALGSRTNFSQILTLDENYIRSALTTIFGIFSMDIQTGTLRVPLVRLREFTPDDLRQAERRVSLYNALLFRPEKYSFEAVYGYPMSQVFNLPKEFTLFPNSVLFSKLPEPAFSTPLTVLKVLPADAARPNVTREFLDSLRTITQPIAFEIIDNGVTNHFQIVCATVDRSLVQHQLELHFPAAVIMEHADIAPVALPCITARPPALYAETRPLSEFPFDPLVQFFSLLNKHSGTHVAALQVLFFPVPNETLTAVADGFQRDATSDNVKAVTRKLPAWQVALRAFSANPQSLSSMRSAFFGQYAVPQYAWMFSDARNVSLTERDMSEWALLSTAELAAVAHFPTTAIEYDRLEKVSTKTKLPPDLFTSGEVKIGNSEARGQIKPVTLPDSVRARHLYVVGKSGSGKSTLITNIALQDIERGEGVCVIDPHGDLVSDLLDHIPEHRVSDTIYFNVSDRAHPIGLDMLNARSEAEIEILTDDLITTFRRLTESWGERMETILRYSFNTLLRTPGATFLDLQKLLTNEGWRSSVVRKLDFPPLVDFWFNQFPNMPKDATQPILSRMTKIVLSPTLNSIFGQSASRLNFNDVIRNRKVLLINLGGDSRDRNNEQLSVSDEMKKLIGSVVVSQLQLAAMRQASIPEAQRVPCRFFVDEFQSFVSGAFPKILSEARKYKLSLTVAHQYISQLDEATRNAVFGNVGTMIVMPLGQKDAAYLGAELGSYTPEDVANLAAERHEALCRPTTSAADTFLFTTLPPKPITRSFAHEIISHTRKQYSPEPENRAEAAAEESSAQQANSPRHKMPMRETPKAFATTSEKIMHFVSQAHYLTTSQIIELCYSHLSETSKRPAASRDLKKLADAKKLKSINWGEGKVFYASGQCNPTAHNVAVRDVLIKIWQSGFEIADINLSSTIGALSPDLLVSFLCEDGALLPTYWEYDTGTEGITELIKKIARYVPYSGRARIAFVCSTKERMQAIMKATKEEFIEFCVLGEFSKLDVPAFVSRANIDKYSFF